LANGVLGYAGQRPGGPLDATDLGAGTVSLARRHEEGIVSEEAAKPDTGARPAPDRAEDPVIAVRDLVKRYPKAKTNAVDGITFEVQPGEVFGLLGPNGAGKTTTVGVLTTRVRPTAGRAWVAGVDVARDPVRARSLLAVVPQRNNLDRSLTIRHNLLFHAAYHGVPRAEARRRAEALLEEFGLAERATDKPDFVSGGQAQRIMIARALMHAPAALFLDEPTTGLDPAARLFVWDRIRDLRARGVTILLTTHDMDEAAELCQRVGIMDHGRLLALDTPEALTRSLPGSQTLDVTVARADGDAGELLATLGRLSGVEKVERVSADTAAAFAGGGGLWPGPFDATQVPHTQEAAATGDTGIRARLYVAGDAPALLVPLARVVSERGATLTDVAIGRPSLEDVFISFTGRALR
jgi:ABC-2 type transport system ATP-binding protein